MQVVDLKANGIGQNKDSGASVFGPAGSHHSSASFTGKKNNNAAVNIKEGLPLLP
jgi:hypothetical protein